MNETQINWTELTWNPWSGCAKISAGCKYCYAEELAENKRGTKAFPVGFDLTYRPHKLAEPRRVKRGSLIFTNSMTDFFFEGATDAMRDDALAVMEAEGRHRYQVLTKRPDLAVKYFATRRIPRSWWLGVTVEDGRVAWRLDALRELHPVVRFVSAEPLIGPLDVADFTGIDWIITGGESGVHMAKPHVAAERGLAERGPDGKWRARADRMHYVRDIRDRCAQSGIAFWHKQWGGVRPHSAGRELDGRTHDGLPTHVIGAMPDRAGGYIHRALHVVQ